MKKLPTAFWPADASSSADRRPEKAKVDESLTSDKESVVELSKYEETATLDAEVLVDGLKLEEAKDKIVTLQNDLLSSAAQHGEDVTSLSKQIEDLYFELSKEKEQVAALKKQADGDVSFDISDVKLNALNRTFLKKEKNYKEEISNMAKELKENDLEHKKELGELRLKIQDEDKKDGMKKDLDEAVQRIVSLQKNLLDVKEKDKDGATTNKDLDTMKAEFSRSEKEYEEEIKRLKEELKGIDKAHSAELKEARKSATASLKKEHEEELRKRDSALEGTIQKFQNKMEKELSHDRTYSDLVQAKEKIRSLESELEQVRAQLKEETGALTQSLQEVQAAFFERETAYNYELKKMSEELRNKESTFNNNPQYQYNAQPPPQQAGNYNQENSPRNQPKSRGAEDAWYYAAEDTASENSQGDQRYSPQQPIGSDPSEEEKKRWSRWASFGNIPFKYGKPDDKTPVSNNAKVQESLPSHHDKIAMSQKEKEFTNGPLQNQQDVAPPSEYGNQYLQDQNFQGQYAQGMYPQDQYPQDGYFPNEQGFGQMMMGPPTQEGIPNNSNNKESYSANINDTGDRWSSFGSTPFKYSINPESASSSYSVTYSQQNENMMPPPFQEYFGDMPPPPYPHANTAGMIQNGPENFGFNNGNFIKDPNGAWYASSPGGQSVSNTQSYDSYEE